MAIRMGIRSLVAQSTSGNEYTIFTDLQAAMARAQNDRPSIGQQRTIETIDVAMTLGARGDSISVRWVPDHRGISGNEAADRDAEAAANSLGQGRRDSSLSTSLAHLHRARTQRATAN